MEKKIEQTTTIPEFHIGLTMAGAASAGCYTAGAMDYLFEILDLWENAKQGILPDGWDNNILKNVPQHKVIIDAMGGTSAGGMTTVMATIYALTGRVNPVNNPADPEIHKDNIMYDSWVLMGDKNGDPKVFETVFNTEDLTDTGKIQSLLNSGFIDRICENAFKNDGLPKTRLPYLSDDFELVLSHTMLRSIPLGVDFNTPTSRLRRKQIDVDHCSFEHFTISHFKLNIASALSEEKFLPLNPFDPKASKALMLATMATGAFPVGLKFRKFFDDELSSNYIKVTAEKTTFNRLSDIPVPDVPTLRLPVDFPDPYQFVSVDGGALNNEPFGEVLAILKERHGKKKPGEDYKYALIMIDPFPDVPSHTPYVQPDDLFSVVPAIVGTLWDQAKVKRAEMLDAYSSEYYRGEIYPVRWERNKELLHPIACGSVMAFGGLLDISFRHHDFFLGRDNARNFYRTFFSMPCKLDTEFVDEKERLVKPYNILSCHPIHQAWSDEMIDLFKRPSNTTGTVLLPIIPDLYTLKEKYNGGTHRNPMERTVPAWPQYDASKLFDLKDKIEERVNIMLELTYKKITSGSIQSAHPLTNEWVSHYYRSNWWQKLKSRVSGVMLKMLIKSNKGNIASRITKAAIEWILKDLETKKLLKKVSPKEVIISKEEDKPV